MNKFYIYVSLTAVIGLIAVVFLDHLPGGLSQKISKMRAPSSQGVSMADWLPRYDDTETWGARKDCTACHNSETGSTYLPKNHQNPHNRVQIKCLQCHQPHPTHLPKEQALFEVADKVFAKSGPLEFPITLQRKIDQDQKCSACHLEQYHRIYGENDQNSSSPSVSSLADRHVQTAGIEDRDLSPALLMPLKINKVTKNAQATFVKGRLCIGCHYSDHSFNVESSEAWDRKCLECHGINITHVRDTGWGCIKCHMTNNWQKKSFGHSL